MTSEPTPLAPDAVVAGVDGSSHDATVIAWAAGAAARSGRRLHLIHAVDEPGQVPRQDTSTGMATGIFERTGHAELDEALEQARASWPDLEITGTEVAAQADRALIRASKHAHLVVVGARRVSGVERLLLGRSPLAVAMHAFCPVVLVPDGARTDADGPVVVGVDGSESAARAAERAFWIAGLRGASVRAVTSWYVEVTDGMVVTTPGTPAWEATEAKYRAVAERSLAAARAGAPADRGRGRHPSRAGAAGALRGGVRLEPARRRQPGQGRIHRDAPRLGRPQGHRDGDPAGHGRAPLRRGLTPGRPSRGSLAPTVGWRGSPALPDR